MREKLVFQLERAREAFSEGKKKNIQKQPKE